MQTKRKKGFLGKKVDTLCPVDYSVLSPELVCKIHGQLERCNKCKQVKHPVRGTCQCVVVIKKVLPFDELKRRHKATGTGKGVPGKSRVGRKPQLKDCLFCGTKSRAQLCEVHQGLRGTIQWWKQRTGKTTPEVVELMKANFKQDDLHCKECGRQITYKSTSGICRRCTIRHKVPVGECITCGEPRYSKVGYFCKKTKCSRVSLRFSYHRSRGKSDEEIMEILKEPIARVRRGEDP